MVNIEIIELGDLYPFSFKKLKAFNSNSTLFKLVENTENRNPDILNNFKSPESFQLNDADFKSLIDKGTKSNFSIIIVNRPLQNNFFSRRLSDKHIVISIFDMDKLSIHEGITLEMYITRFIYGFVSVYRCFNNSLPSNEIVGQFELFQNDAKGCLFDFCIYKPQVAMFFREPKISPEALVKLRTKSLPAGFIEALNKEILKLKISRYYKIKDWLKANPVKAILFTFLVGLIFSELLGNLIYDLILAFKP